MSETTKSVSPRREFLKNTARIAAASALAGVAIPRVHAGEDNTIRLALIGSGDRGSGAVGNALAAKGGPAKLVAMADLFPDRLEASYKALSGARRQDRRAKGSPIPGLRRLPQGDRLPAPRRHGPLDHARRVPGNAPRLRRAEGRERVHGEDVRARSGRRAADPPPRRGGGKEEPENRRRTDVPPLVRTTGDDPKNPRRRSGADPAHPRLSDGVRRGLAP